MTDKPSPERRKNFTPRTKGLIRERSAGQCEVHLVPRCMYPALPEACKREGSEVDHITPDWAGGSNAAENGALLCGLCHKLKTVTDNKEAKKSNRIQKKAAPQDAGEPEKPHRKMGKAFWKPPGYVSQINSKSPQYKSRGFGK